MLPLLNRSISLIQTYDAWREHHQSRPRPAVLPIQRQDHPPEPPNDPIPPSPTASPEQSQPPPHPQPPPNSAATPPRSPPAPPHDPSATPPKNFHGERRVG